LVKQQDWKLTQLSAGFFFIVMGIVIATHHTPFTQWSVPFGFASVLTGMGTVLLSVTGKWFSQMKKRVWIVASAVVLFGAAVFCLIYPLLR
jgi:hypothetical protein